MTKLEKAERSFNYACKQASKCQHWAVYDGNDIDEWYCPSCIAEGLMPEEE